MAKDLPYFRWYPADAETDEAYAAMTDPELGFFHRALNRAWINEGLPANLDELARMMHVTRKYLDKVWPKIARCWQERDGRLYNRRQEEERAHAKSKSEKAADAVRTRYGRNTDDVPRARARADSDSDSSVVQKEKLREFPKNPDYQYRFEVLYAKHPVAGFKADGQLRYLEVIKASANPEIAADAIDRAHAEYCAFWQANPTEFRPGIGKFFEDGWYLRKPQARARDSTQSRRLTPTEVALQRAREEERNAARTQ